MNRATYFRDGLPLLEPVLLHYVREEWKGFRVVVVGPTRQELQEHAPQLSALLAATSKMSLIPVGDVQDLLEIQAELYRLVYNESDWEVAERGPVGGRSHAIVVVIPPSVKWSFRDDEYMSALESRELALADPGLAFLRNMAVVQGGRYELALVSAMSIGSAQNNAVRNGLIDAAGTDYREAIAYLRNDRESWASQAEIILEGNDRTAALDRSFVRAWSSRTRHGHCPWFVWQLDGHDPHSAPVIVGFDTGGLPQSVHTRVLSRDTLEIMRDDPTRVAAMLSVANGEGERAEDDAFVPLRVMRRSGSWKTGHREFVGLSRESEALGYPLVALSDICEAGAVGSSDDRAAAWLCTKGVDAGGAKTTHPSDIANWIPLVCEDAELLVRVLNEPSLQEEIRCRSYGSYRKPVVAAGTLRSFTIPWPSPSERMRLMASIQKWRGSAGDATDTVASLSSHAEDLETAVDSRAPWVFEAVFERFANAVEDARKGIGRTRKQEMPAPNPEPTVVWPSLVAVLRRRIESETAPNLRFQRSLDLAEVVIRYDTAVCLALLGKVAPDRVHEFVSQGRRSTSEPTWSVSLGSWRALGRSSRRAIENWLRDHKAEQSVWRSFGMKLCSGSVVRLDTAADKLVEIRNRTKGHGFTQNDAQSLSRAEEILTLVSQMLDECAYVRHFLLFKLEQVARGKSNTSVTRLVLAHDNPEHQRQQVQRTVDSPYEKLPVGEVYLDLGCDDECLSLWPWVTCEPGSQGTQCVWLLDGVNKRGAAFVSPMDIEKRETSDDCAGIRSVLGM